MNLRICFNDLERPVEPKSDPSLLEERRHVGLNGRTQLPCFLLNSRISCETGYVFTRTLNWMKNLCFTLSCFQKTKILFSGVGFTQMNSSQAYSQVVYLYHRSRKILPYKRRWVYLEEIDELIFSNLGVALKQTWILV